MHYGVLGLSVFDGFLEKRPESGSNPEEISPGLLAAVEEEHRFARD